MVKLHSSSRSLPATSMVGSGDLCHAYIQYPPLRCSIPGAAGLMYDDGNKLVLVPSPNKVLSWSVNGQAPLEDPTVTNFREGPVRFVRFSLDRTILAVQRSGQDVEFINTEKGIVFHQRCSQGSEEILGLFWTDSPTCDVVFVTSSGLELYALSSDKTWLKLVEAKKLNVSWYVYTHESRLVLLASGMQCKTLFGYQFSAGGIIRLPKFDVTMAKTEVNSKPVLASQDVHIATMYGRLYCLQVDRVSLQLRLYRFYRDAVVPQSFLPIYSSNVALSIVDNVLLIHEIDSKVVLLYDILSSSKAPISAPLPLLLQGVPSNGSLLGTHQSLHSQRNSPEVSRSGSSNSGDAAIYDQGWSFENPDIVLDNIHGLLWKIRLDLEAIAASSSDIPSLLAFLQRRYHEASKAKLLSMEVVRSIIIERQPLPLIARAMDVLTSSYARVAKLTSNYGGATVTKNSTGASGACANSRASRNSGIAIDSRPGFVRSVQKINTTVEPSVGHAHAESSTARWLQRSLDEDGDNCHINPKVEHAIPYPLTDEYSAHSEHGSVSEISFNNGEAEIDSSTVPCPAGSSIARQDSRRAWQQNHNEVFATESGEWEGANSPLISPEEMQQGVFNPIEEDMTVDSTFVVAAIIEYIQSAAAEQLKVNPGLHVLLIQLLAQQQEYYELWQLIVGKVLLPSKAVALQLLEVGTQNTPIRKLGLEMLRQLHEHTDYVNFLVKEGRTLEGLCYIRQSKMEANVPELCSQAAIMLQDSEPQRLASVFRFCLESIPNFRQTSDFTMYSSILNHD